MSKFRQSCLLISGIGLMFLEQYEIWLARDALSLASDLSIECIAPNSRPSLIGWQDVGHHAFFSWQY